jgi:hypothetical protein
LDDELDLDYNRVKLETLFFSPSLVWNGAMGSKIKLGINFETIQVDETEDRFINLFYQDNGEETRNQFVGAAFLYTYENHDSSAFPTLGMSTTLLVGYKSNLDVGARSFGYVSPSLSIDHKLLPNGRLVLATKWKGYFNLGTGYEFYQAATIGGVDGLRSFRNQRFSGKTAYYQSTDLRYNIGRVRSGILPTAIGLYGGFDYGRVWEPGEDSDKWHNSYGGGIFLNAANLAAIRMAIFTGAEGIRFAFGLGFEF